MNVCDYLPNKFLFIQRIAKFTARISSEDFFTRSNRARHKILCPNYLLSPYPPKSRLQKETRGGFGGTALAGDGPSGGGCGAGDRAAIGRDDRPARGPRLGGNRPGSADGYGARDGDLVVRHSPHAKYLNCRIDGQRRDSD